MNWANWVKTARDAKCLRPDMIAPGEEPAWLRRKAEYERELPLLMAERKAAASHEHVRLGLASRLWMAVRRGYAADR